MNEPYVLLDIRGLVLRSLHSGNDKDATIDSTGKAVNSPGHAVDVFVNTYLLEILRTYRLKTIIAVWDGGNKYRENLCASAGLPEYKGNRKKREKSPELEEAMRGAQESVKDLLKSMGVTQVHAAGVEADDVIAWMVRQLPTDILIYTVDQDLMALATEPGASRVVAINIANKWPTCYEDERGNKVPYRFVSLYKSMVGDSSDGYKGIDGFGPAAWEKLVADYGINNLGFFDDAGRTQDLSYLRQVVGAEPGQHPLIEKILAKAGTWIDHYQLAMLHPELVNRREDNKFNRPRWTLRLPNSEKLSALLERTGCRHLLPQLMNFMPSKFLLDATDFDEGQILEDAKALFAESPFVSIDWETSAPPNENFKEAARGREVVDMLSSRITGAGFTFGRNLQHTFYATFDHSGSSNLPISLLPKLIDCVPADKPLVAQNFYFERTVYKGQFGKELPNLHDTKIMSHHVDEQENNGLKDMSLRLLGYQQLHYGDVIEKGKSMKDYSAEHVFAYGADDPLVTAHLYEFLKLQLLLEGTWDFVREYEFPAVYQISDAYLGGINIDWDELEVLRQQDEQTFEENMARLRELIAEHQTPEHLQKGIENLVEIESEVLRKTLANDPTAMGEGLATLRDKVAERVTYAPYVRVEKPVDFTPTCSKLKAVAQYLRLPEFPDWAEKGGEKAAALKAADKRAVNTQWFFAAKEQAKSADAEEFVRLIGENLETLHSSPKKPPAERQALIALGSKLYREAMGDKAYVWTGSELSLNSPRQMQALLYGMLALPLRIRNFDVSEARAEHGLDGAAQANEDAVVTAMAEDAPEGTWQREALECLLAAKKADTRRKTFYSTYPLWKHPLTGRVHAQLNSVGTETRRMSGNAPNLMQLPKRGEGIKVRNILLPSEGHDLIVSIDWSGEELRVAAGLSLDDEMLSCYIDGEVLKTLPQWMLDMLGPDRIRKFKKATLRDIHSLTASGIARLSYEEFEAIRHDDSHPRQKEMKAIRGSAKTVNFLSQYGGGAAKLARKLICDVDTAKEYLIAKRNLYSGYEDWRTQQTEILHSRGYLRTLYGSYRHSYDKLLTSDEGMRGYVERSALNSLVQGVCADILKVVLTRLWKAKTFERHGAQFVAPIHDELVFSCHSSRAADLILEVHNFMVEPVPGLPCPLTAEASVGPSFGVQIEVGSTLNQSTIATAIAKALGHTLQEAA